MTARDAEPATAAQTSAAFGAVHAETVRQRARLRAALQARTQTVERAEAQLQHKEGQLQQEEAQRLRVDSQLRAVGGSFSQRKAALDDLVRYEYSSRGSADDRVPRSLGEGHDPDDSLKKTKDVVLRIFGRNQRERALLDSAIAQKSTALSVDTWLRQDGDGAWVMNEDIARQFDSDYNTARNKLAEARKRFFGSDAERAGIAALGSFIAQLIRLREVHRLLAGELRQAKADRDEAAAARDQAATARDQAATDERAIRTGRATADRALEEALSDARQAAEMLPAPLQPWEHEAWREWTGLEAIEGTNALLVGTLSPIEDNSLGANSDFGTEASISFYVSLRQNLRLVYTNRTRKQALALARSLLLRQLASVSPGELHFVFFDPVGLGQSVADLLDLAEYDAGLIGGKVWSSQQDLAARLAEQTAHIELVTQKYLRSTYDNIDDFNRAAGEVAEPYRLLVLFDIPTGLSEETMGRLNSIVTNGPRCGVHTLLLTNSSVEAPYGVDLSQINEHVHRIDLDAELVVFEEEGYKFELSFHPDAVPPEAEDLARTIVDRVGRAAIGRTESTVTFDKVMRLFSAVAGRGIRTELPQSAAATQVDDRATWWGAPSTRGLYAPIGQRGARDAAILGFDSGNNSGALLVGRPGSGKSTLLHTYIGGLTTVYGPDELELYLIDFKEGVEFKSYATEGLPHARVVAIESDREFGVSVLQSLRDELTRRGDLFRSTGGQHAGIREFREAAGESLPRVLLVFDEFQVLFAKNDKLGLAAADLLETIIRQGRGFGVHVVLGSQSLSGLDALGAHVPQLLPTRILLPASDLDGRRVLGDGNDAGQYLTTHGEGILNSAGGAVEANERFKGALLAEKDRIARLRILREKADRAGFSRRPTVFEGNASVPLESIDPSVFREQMASSGVAGVRMRVGEPMTVSGLADIELKREAGANVLAVVRDGERDDVLPSAGPAYGLLTAAVASAAQSRARVDVIDFMSVDDGLDEVLEPFLDRGRLTLRRRRAFAPLVEELAAEVDDRVSQDDAFRTARVAFLFGIHRARELDAEIGSLDADAELTDALERIMRDGPEFGVHVWLWADTVNGVSRRLTSRMMRECGWRVASKMSPDDSRSLIGTEQAGEIRDRQLVLSNDDLGMETRAMSFSAPPRSWLEDVLGPADPADQAQDDPVDQAQEG